MSANVDYEDKKKPSKLSVEDKRAAIKQLIDQIPTEKSELFAWKMDWDQVDQVRFTDRYICLWLYYILFT